MNVFFFSVKALVILGWLVAAFFNLSVLYGLYNEANGHPLPIAADSIYAGTHRIVWAMGLGWLIFACATGHGGR